MLNLAVSLSNHSLKFEHADIQYLDTNLEMSPRKFGAAFRSQRTIGIFGGLSTQARTSSTDLLDSTWSRPMKDNLNGEAVLESTDWALPNQIEPRMCHAIATSKVGICLLIGGRASPDRPIADCWYSRNGWRQVENLPYPLYRHCATWIDFTLGASTRSGVLVYGGKTYKNEICGQWLLWRESTGWEKVNTQGAIIRPRFAATMASTATNSGLLTGGMTEGGILLPKIWQWTMKQNIEGELFLYIEESKSFSSIAAYGLARMGAQLTCPNFGIFLIGGVGNGPLKQKNDVLSLRPPSPHDNSWRILPLGSCDQGLRRLLVGHSALALDDCVLVTGGGAVCFCK